MGSNATHEEVVAAAAAAGIFLHDSPFDVPSSSAPRSQLMGSNAFRCGCRRNFHCLAPLFQRHSSRRSTGQQNEDTDNDPQICRWCLSGHLDVAASGDSNASATLLRDATYSS